MTQETIGFDSEQPSIFVNIEWAEEALRRAIVKRLLYWLEVFNQQHRIATVNWSEATDRLNCTVDVAYDRIIFGVNLKRIMAESDPEELDWDLCHEVAHVVTWPLSQLASDILDRLEAEDIGAANCNDWQKRIERAEEYVTTLVERAVIGAYNAGRNEHEDGDT